VKPVRQQRGRPGGTKQNKVIDLEKGGTKKSSPWHLRGGWGSGDMNIGRSYLEEAVSKKWVRMRPKRKALRTTEVVLIESVKQGVKH